MFFYMLAACVVIVSCAEPVDEDKSRLSLGITKFSQKLFQQMSYTKPVLLFSPYSIHSALTMAYLGAREETADEMRSVLEISNVSDPHASHGRLLVNLRSVKNTNIGNSLWFAPEKDIIPSYKDDLFKFYDAEVSEIEFNNPFGPEKPINDWVARKTDGNVKTIINSEELKKGKTELVLVNVVYVNGRWKKPFSEKNNLVAPFAKKNGETVKTDFMSQSGEFEYKESALEKYDLLKLELDDGELSLYVFLSHSSTETNLNDLTIIEADLDDLVEDMKKTELTVTIPKFKISSSMKLKNILSEMGMPTAFRDNATFSGISNENLKISNVIQKSEIEVKEAGLTAEASTAVPIEIKKSLPEFKANHPFIFWLRNDRTRTILFMGKFNDPSISEIEIH